MAMAVELDTQKIFRESISLDAIAIRFAYDEFINEQCSFSKRVRSTDQVLRNQIRNFIAKTENRRWLDPHKRRFRGNHVFQQLNVPRCKFLSVTQEPFRDLGAAAIDVIWNNNLITEPIEKSYRLNSDLGIIVIGKLITKKKDTAIGQ